MNYTYIICLVLSSFFTYNPANADTNTNINAFFIPGGAFQQNTQTLDIKQMKPRYSMPSAPIQQEIDEEIPQIAAPAPIKKTAKNTSKAQISKDNAPAPTASASLKVEQLPETQTAELPSPKRTTTKYKLDDELPSAINTNENDDETTIADNDNFEQKSVKEMLEALPSPDFNLPKYQQIYALYGLELRSTYRRGKLPSNFEQETTLSKANSIRRFEVK